MRIIKLTQKGDKAYIDRYICLHIGGHILFIIVNDSGYLENLLFLDTLNGLRPNTLNPLLFPIIYIFAK